jgi:hypothetical protein
MIAPRYTIEEIRLLEQKVDVYEFSDKTLDLINNIAKQVGAPGYIKTPIFKRSKNKIVKPIVSEISTRDSHLKNITMILNKMSPNNYEKLKNEITILLKNMNDDDLSLNEVNKVIFHIVCKQKMNVSIFAKLYSHLIEEFPLLKNICLQYCDNYIDMFNNINVCDPNKDYEGFCKNNIENEKRKNISLFYVELVKNSILNIDYIIELIFSLNKILLEKGINEGDYADLCIEVADNIVILVSNSLSILKETDSWDEILKSIENVRNIDKKIYKNITSRLVFKYMDILDKIKK